MKKNLPCYLNCCVWSCVFFSFVLLFCSATPVWAGEAELANYIESLTRFRPLRSQNIAPVPSREEIIKGLQGELIIHKIDVNETGLRMIYAAKVVELDPVTMWLTLIDREHYDDISDTIVDSFIMRRYPGYFLNYNVLEAPLVSTRHQVLKAEVNVPLYQASEGRMWEHYWNRVTDIEERIAEALAMHKLRNRSVEDLKDAVVVALNQGSWLLVPLPDGRTWAETCTIKDPGGRIPDFVVRKVGAMATSGTFAGYEKWGRERILNHMTAEHELILAPDGPYENPVALRTRLGNLANVRKGSEAR